MCILNDDTIVHEGAFDRMVRYMDEHPEVGMLGAKLENPDGSIQNCTFRFWSLRAEIIAIALLPASMCHLKGDVIDPAQFSDRPAEVDWVLGACMVVRETTLRQIGGLDNELSPVAYMEEVDWCWRAHCAGWKVGYCPSAVVTHFGGQSTKHESAGADRMRVELCRTHVAYFRKHFGGGQALLLRLIYVLALPWNAMMVTQSLLRRRIGMRQYRSTLATSFQVATRVWRPENRRVKGGARGSS
jgi:GT2 family glycosyltransferase